MDIQKEAYVKSLGKLGYIKGATYSLDGTPMSHYYGGVRYGSPPERWKRALPLAPDFTYGTVEHPGSCEGGSSVCPQKEWDGSFKEDDWSEDCLQCNIWTPIGDPPQEGWPVLVFIHGGWLQTGTPNEFIAASLIGQGDFRGILVMPAYRLGVFGFTYASELEEEAAAVGTSAGNVGFWDQRLALEWVSQSIHHFGGNGNNITISGYSAGAYSVFHQLAYELSLPNSSIVKRACMWSNGPGIQPKSTEYAQQQFDQLTTALNIPSTLSPVEKLSYLRTISSKKLLDAALSIRIHQFRPTSDGIFVKSNLIRNIQSFAKSLVDRKIQLMIGECKDEPYLYSMWNAPQQNNLESFRERLLAEYTPEVVNGLINIYFPDTKLPDRFKDWKHAFGAIYADMQVYRLGRGLIKTIAEQGGENLLHRYRIEYRLKCVDGFLPPEAGVTHGTDEAIWFWGSGRPVQEEEKAVIREAFIDPLSKFVRGEPVGWGTNGYKSMRRLKADGTVDCWQDEAWDDEDPVWRLVRGKV